MIVSRTLMGLSFGLALAGCGAELPLAPAQPAPPNYARLTANNFATALPKISQAGATISAIQPAVAPQPANWFACVKFASGEYYAVFLTDGAITDTRIALGIDRCNAATGYVALPPPEKPKPATPGTADKPAKPDTADKPAANKKDGTN